VVWRRVNLACTAKHQRALSPPACVARCSLGQRSHVFICLLPDRPLAPHSSPRLARPGARPAPACRRVRRAPQQRTPVQDCCAGERRPPRVRPKPRRHPRGCAAQRAHQAPRQQLLRVPHRRAHSHAGGAGATCATPALGWQVGCAGAQCRAAAAAPAQAPPISFDIECTEERGGQTPPRRGRWCKRSLSRQ